MSSASIGHGVQCVTIARMSEQYELYKQDWCMFCRRVRAFLEDAGIDIPERDTMLDREADRELREGGGRATVPCLKITSADGEVRWLYESRDIMEYLGARAG